MVPLLLLSVTSPPKTSVKLYRAGMDPEQEGESGSPCRPPHIQDFRAKRLRLLNTRGCGGSKVPDGNATVPEHVLQRPKHAAQLPLWHCGKSMIWEEESQGFVAGGRVAPRSTKGIVAGAGLHVLANLQKSGRRCERNRAGERTVFTRKHSQIRTVPSSLCAKVSDLC